MQGKVLLTALRLAAPGLYPVTAKSEGDGPIFTNFCFYPGRVLTTNSMVGIRVSLPENSFTGCLPGFSLMKAAKQLEKEEEVEIVAGEHGDATLYGGSVRIDMATRDIEEMGEMLDFVELVSQETATLVLQVTEELSRALATALEVCMDLSKTPHTEMAGVTIIPEGDTAHVYATNNVVIVHIPVPGAVRHSSADQAATILTKNFVVGVIGGFKNYGATAENASIRITPQYALCQYDHHYDVYVRHPEGMEPVPYEEVLAPYRATLGGYPQQPCTLELRTAFRRCKSMLVGGSVGLAQLKARKKALRLAVSRSSSRYTEKVTLDHAQPRAFKAYVDAGEVCKFIFDAEYVRVAPSVMELEFKTGGHVYLALPPLEETEQEQ